MGIPRFTGRLMTLKSELTWKLGIKWAIYGRKVFSGGRTLNERIGLFFGRAVGGGNVTRFIAAHLVSYELERIVPFYQKIGGSRAIGPYLDPDNTRSDSFRVFVSGIRLLCSNEGEKMIVKP